LVTQIETELIKSASGDTVTLLLILFVTVVLGLLGLLINFMLKTLPQEMEKDRQNYAESTEKDRQTLRESIDKVLTELKEMRMKSDENTCKQLEIIDKHNEQAKRILEVDLRIENELNNRPCAAKKLI